MCVIGHVAIDIWSSHTPRHHKRTIKASKNFDYLWNTDVYSIPVQAETDGTNRFGEKEVFIAADDEMVTIAAYRWYSASSQMLTSYYLSSGEKKWHTNLSSSGGYSRVAFAHNTQTIFAFLPEKGATGALHVSAIDRKTGIEIWARQFDTLNLRE